MARRAGSSSGTSSRVSSAISASSRRIRLSSRAARARVSGFDPLQHVGQRDQGAEQLVRRLHLDEGLAGARAGAAADADGVEHQGARGLDPLAHMAAVAAGMLGPGDRVRGVGSGQDGQVAGQDAQAAVHLGHRAPGGTVGVQAPDHHGQHERPQAAAHEGAIQHQGGVQALAPVHRQHGDDGQQVADLQRRLPPHADEAGAEDHGTGDRHDDRQPQRAQQP